MLPYLTSERQCSFFVQEGHCQFSRQVLCPTILVEHQCRSLPLLLITRRSLKFEFAQECFDPLMVLRSPRCLLIPFRLNNGAYDVWIISFTFSVGGASCPAYFAQRQDFLLRSTQVSLLDPRHQCTCILEKWYYTISLYLKCISSVNQILPMRGQEDFYRIR